MWSIFDEIVRLDSKWYNMVMNGDIERFYICDKEVLCC